MKAKVMFVAAVAVLALAVALTYSNASSFGGGTAMDQREKCMTHCNDAYGGLEWFRPPSGGAGVYQGWSNCMLRCDRQYWDRFDKESEIDD